jgi:hypothetical protein
MSFVTWLVARVVIPGLDCDACRTCESRSAGLVVPGCWPERKRGALPGASGDHGLVPDLLWEDVREWFEPDGSLLDAYVFDTTVADWQALVDFVRSRGWWFAYSEDGRPRRLPFRVEDVFARRGEMAVLLQVRPVPEVRVNVHFFTDEEIEVDFAPEELQGQERLDLLCSFLRAVGRRLGKPVVLTPENLAHRPLIGYDTDADRVLAMAS